VGSGRGGCRKVVNRRRAVVVVARVWAGTEADESVKAIEVVEVTSERVLAFLGKVRVEGTMDAEEDF
jgi:hypothetical protein